MYLGIGLTGLAGAANLKIRANKKAKEAINAEAINALENIVPKTARKKVYGGPGKGIYKVGEGLGIGKVGTNPETIPVNGGKAVTSPQVKQLKTVDKIYRGLMIGGLGSAAYQKTRALAAKYRTTPMGHARAVVKRDLWKREMDRAFAGTRYGNSGIRRKK